MKKRSDKPTDSEMEILQILWSLDQASVREINDVLSKRREVGYTTTLKMMQIMLDKGYLKRNAESRTHIYTAAIDEQKTQKKLLDRFIDSTFRGSKMKMVMQALGNGETSDDELSELKALIEKMENQKK